MANSSGINVGIRMLQPIPKTLLIPEFHEEDHSYLVHGKRAPGVTTILRSCGIGVNSFWTVEGREFGRAVHMACRYQAEADLDFSLLADTVKPRVEAYNLFCQDMNFAPDLIEQPLYRERPLYCGTPDQVQLDRAVVDFKCGAHDRSHALQLAAYAFLLPNPHIYERWAVHLLETGQYSLRVFSKQELMGDWAVFQSCLNVENWKARTNGK